MAHDESSNSVETDDVQRDVDAMLSEADRAERQFEEEDSSAEASDEPRNGRSRDQAGETPTDDLDGPVDDLISDAVSAVESIESDLKSGADPSAEDTDAVDAIADTVDDLVEEAAQAIREGEPTEKVAVVEFEDDFDDDVEDAPSATVTPPAPAPAPSAGAPVPDDSPQTIEALDARIEAEAEAFEEELDELEGDFHSADEIEALDDAPPPSMKSDAETADDDADDDADDLVAEISLDDEDEEPTVEMSSPTRPATVDSPFADAATAPARAAAPKKAPPKPAAPAKKAPAKKSKASRSQWKVIGPIATRFVLTTLARPLGKLDPVVRDSIGWVGLNTLFIALCLWIYLLLR